MMDSLEKIQGKVCVLFWGYEVRLVRELAVFIFDDTLTIK